MAIGDRVIAKNRNGRYYHCLVTSLSNTLYYKVAFEDGTFSDDMFPEDIEVPSGLFFLVIANCYFQRESHMIRIFMFKCLKPIYEIAFKQVIDDGCGNHRFDTRDEETGRIIFRSNIRTFLLFVF